MAMTLTDVRTWSRQFVRNAQSSSMYPDDALDRAIQIAADEWLRINKATRTFGTMTLTANSNVLPAAPTGWQPEFHLQAFLLDPTPAPQQPTPPPLNFVDYSDVLSAIACGGTATARPQIFAYEDAGTNGICYPTPDAAYRIGLWYWQEFTAWTPGASGTLTFNLPDDHLRVISVDGVRAFLQSDEPENAALAETALSKFRDRARQFAGRNAGGRGGTISFKAPPDRGGGYVTGAPGRFYPVG